MRRWRKRQALGLSTNRRLIKADSINGKKFGRLTAICRAAVNSFGGYRWLCQCSCGKVVSIDRGNLAGGQSTSCGCFRSEAISKRRTSHGETRRNIVSVEYTAWIKMHGRCYNSGDPKFYCYGARGIKVCRRWKNRFENFLADMGRRPSSKHSVNRKNNNGPYSPKNCEWATAKQQSRNKTTTRWLRFKGKKISMSDAAEKFGISYYTLKSRLRSGWSDKAALTAPIKGE